MFVCVGSVMCASARVVEMDGVHEHDRVCAGVLLRRWKTTLREGVEGFELVDKGY